MGAITRVPDNVTETVHHSDATRRRRWWASSAVYLSLILCGRLVYDLLITTNEGSWRIAGFEPAALVLLITMLATLIAWLPAERSGEWGVLPKVWFVLVVLLWLYLAIAEDLQGGVTQAPALFIPVSIVLLWLKRPRASDVWVATDAFAWTIIVTSALALVLEVTGVIPSWYESLGGRFLELREYDLATHWLPLAQGLGLDARWGGIMRDPNLMGPIGVFLSVYGFGRMGLRRWTFVVAGLIIVVLADSRATYGALIVGVGLLLLLPGWGVRWSTPTAPKAVALAVVLLSGLRILRDFTADPVGTLNMSGRTGMWPDFLSLWNESPIYGVGTARIVRAVAEGTLPEWSYHGHNQYVDMLVRYGVLGLVLSLAVLGVAFLISASAARGGFGLGVALMGVLGVVTMTHLVFDWRYPGPGTSELLALVLLSATVSRKIGGTQGTEPPTGRIDDEGSVPIGDPTT
jgi:hypothetical protein